MDDEIQVRMQRGEWNQLVAIVANATGWPVINKFFQQVQAAQQPQPQSQGNGADFEPVSQDRIVPRRYSQP